jgi:hypothetical protein
MEATTTSTDNGIVDELEFGSRTAKRVGWEAFEFSIVGPHQVEVINASYGFEKDDHSYTVGVEVRDGVAIPVECGCPADIHREPDCKHKVALAAMGGPTVMNAAVKFEEWEEYDPTPPFPRSQDDATTTVADKIETDGGPETCQNGNAFCDGSTGSLPCFACFGGEQ